MADANLPPRPMPRHWDEAFAAIALEPAPADGWARLSTALPGNIAARDAVPRAALRGRRGRRLMLAAAASVIAALPAAWWLAMPEPVRDQPARVAAPGGVPARANDPGIGTAALHVPRGVDSGSEPGDAAPVAGVADAAASRTPAPSLQATSRRHDSARPSRPRAMPAVAAADVPTLPASPHTSMPTPAARLTAEPGASQAEPATDLAALHRESARLEALVAYARDERMASAPAAVVSATLDERIGLIDTALMQPGLDEPTRAALWTERVLALRELASLEGTQRWMAAQGVSMDAVARVD
ncbi:MAG: hypothetical protein ACOY37_01490 [Pseudomonadota bacterium]